ncbi:hypothetical protein [Mesorhizobium sp. WSM2239]|uniref:DUF4175 domain-containing protein n=2 Tax=unclassified Mesorhizobium TaxID=325217 RepID=A0AAU8D2I5_9HYPH
MFDYWLGFGLIAALLSLYPFVFRREPFTLIDGFMFLLLLAFGPIGLAAILLVAGLHIIWIIPWGMTLFGRRR